jgi:protein-tyrosine-phosphatase/predicted ATP-grasp superfamily ATP-dependent carboligase
MLSKKENYKGKALVLGDDDRSFLTVVRSLGRKNISVHTGWCSPASFALHSKYVTKVHNIPLFSLKNDSWKKTLISIFQQENFDLVIPCNDLTMIPLQTYRSELEKYAPIYLLSDMAFNVTQDKIKAYELAISNKIPVPKSIIIDRNSDISKILSNFKFPVVLKPRLSVTPDDLENKHFVRKVYTKDELTDHINYILKDNEEIQAQDNFVGTGVGIEVLVDKGEILVVFQHIRVHEPLMGGGSTYRKSADPHPELLDATKKLMKSLNYTGVAMVEFKINFNTGKWIFVEINGRFWGSLPLAVSSGVDFPYYLYELLVNKQRDFPQEYKKGIYCRNFLYDLDWIVQNFYADKSDETLATLSYAELAREILHILSLKERSDVFVLDDLGPGGAELNYLVKTICSSARDNISLLPLSISSIRKKYTQKAKDSIKNANSILFVCMGNICRSPFAQYYAQTFLPKNIEVLSCGYDTYDGRSSPHEAIAAAKKFGIDLTTHRSKEIDKNLIQNAQSIFVFDEKTRNILLSRYPSSKKKIHRLGLLVGKKHPIIADPYGGNLKTFIETYQKIIKALKKVHLNKS